MSERRIAIDDIEVGDRYRKDLGNIVALSKSIDKLGLLHPIVLDSKNKLVAGLRRLEAVRMLGWEDVPYRTMKSLDDALPALKAEQDENTCREPFAPMEMVSLGKALEALESPLAAERKKDASRRGGKIRQGSVVENLHEADGGATRDKVGEALGVSGVTYQRMKAVAKAAEDDPETFGTIAEEMNATGKVMPAFEKVQAIKRDPVAKPENNGASLKSSKAVLLAEEAINCLKRIPTNAPDRKQSFQRVADFIKHNMRKM